MTEERRILYTTPLQGPREGLAGLKKKEQSEERTTKRMKKIIFASALAAVLVGCDNAQKPAAPAAATNATANVEHKHEKRPSVRYETLKPEDVVMSVGEHKLTKASIETECDIQLALAAMANKNLTLEQAGKIKDRVRDAARKRYLLRWAVLDEAERRGYVVSNEAFTAFCDKFAKNLSRRSKKQTFAQITNRLTSAQAQILVDDLRRDCLYQQTQAILREECSVSVTKEEAERRFRLITSYNKKAREKEKEIYQNATNVWNRLKGGADFETVVGEFAGQAPEIDADMDWGTFQRGFFKEDANIYDAIPKMSVGEFTAPIEGNGGLIIFQVVDIQPPTAEAAAGGDFYHLAKIFFQLPIIYDLTDVDALQKQLVKELSDEKLQRKLLDLQLTCKVDHPNGAVDMRPTRPALPIPTPATK